MKEFATSIELYQKMKEAESLIECFHIAQHIIFPEGHSEEILLPNRRFLKKGQLLLVDQSTGEKQPMACFLFNDMLLIARAQELFGVTRPGSGFFSSSSRRERSNISFLSFFFPFFLFFLLFFSFLLFLPNLKYN